METVKLLQSINPLNLRGSWKTSLCGTVALIAFAASELEAFPGHSKAFEFIGLVAVSVGAMLARDADKSSEDQGIKPKTQ